MMTAARMPGERRETFLTRLWKALRVYRRYPLDCLQPADEICRALERLNPDAIIGYPSVLAHVAPVAEGRLSHGTLRFIIAGGEALTAAKRRAIERGFGVRAFDIFGAHECGRVASECPETGLYHVCDDNVIVEVLRDGRPTTEGESGELVVTALHCYTMPFIRYRMCDIVVKGPETCPCGQPFSTLQSIGGRVRDYLLLPDGRRVHALEAIRPVITADVSWLDQYQLTQETETRFVLRIAPLGSPVPEELETMRKTVAERLGRGATLKIELVDHIAFEPSGKFKDCRCLVRAGGE
jgi:phenylacetate-CoA ligase